jgi:hypothetical protein
MEKIVWIMRIFNVFKKKPQELVLDREEIRSCETCIHDIENRSVSWYWFGNCVVSGCFKGTGGYTYSNWKPHRIIEPEVALDDIQEFIDKKMAMDKKWNTWVERLE